MDNLETLSDCSESSRNSEGFSSDVSTFSSLSEYQSEFHDLKQLVTTKGSSTLKDLKKRSEPKPNILFWYKQQIEKLDVELKNSIKQNEKYKNDIIKLDKTKDIFYSEKIDSLVKQNKKLNGDLSAANQQIQRLISICHQKDECAHNVHLEEKIFQLEKLNQQLSNQNYLLSNKINQCNLEKSETENEYRSFKTEFNAFQLELAAKINSINELKKKISEQHIQMQEISQSNVKLAHSLDLISNELEHTRKSENWYKSELREVQQEKNTIHEKLMEREKINSLQEEKIDELKLELNSVKCTCDEIRLTALKEKESMLKQLEFLDKHVTNSPNRNSNASLSSDIGNLTNHYESIVKDLTSDVGKIKADFDHQQRCLENVSKEKFEILKKYLSLQNCVKDKDNSIKKLQSNINVLNEQLSSAVSKQKEQSSELLDVKKRCAKLEIEVNLKTKDNDMFEASVNTIREQFKMFSSKHVQLKNELYLKTKEILQLQYEKQQLCLNNNKKTSELQRSIENSALEIEKLKQKIIHLENTENDMKAANNTHLKTIENQSAEMERLQTNLNELQTNFVSFQAENSITHQKNEFISGNTINGLDVLKSVCKFCKINDDDIDYDSITDQNKNNYVDVLLNKIQSRFQFIEAELACKNDADIDRKKKSSVLKRNVIARIVKLVDRCKILEERNEENTKLLEALNCQDGKDYNSGDEIQRLQTLLQVKTQEEKDKQKRYERNYRTLLRKVKEHMKGRKIAEKHNTYLQELHNTLSNERNTLKLQLDLKNSEINDLQIQTENCLRSNEKLKLTVLKLEKEMSNVNFCKHCRNFEMLKTVNNELQQTIKKYENIIVTKTADLKLKEEFITNLQKENERLVQEMSSKNTENTKTVTLCESLSQNNKQLSAKVDDLANQLTEEIFTAKQLKQNLVDLESNCKKLQNENCQLTTKLNHVMEKNVLIGQELNHLNLCLQRKSEEVNELQLRKEDNISRWQQKETMLQNLITDLKNQLHLFKNEISTLKNEKFFLQRMCNDLKVALKTQVNQNKTFKECFDKVVKERERIDNKPVILSNFPSPMKNDDVYIERLLEENRMPFQDKPLCDIQECLATLRKEILFLQKQISDKNMV